ncbi:glycosyltransferase [Dyadobacter fermentans]|uniref:Glycosyl transferase group 1 n=1 Tax=Dyadobacter fermentans (strain ATCC 700827 / DSM 18053 / CIP 107007 / KCTC 52180 / NS114) TaxID=471854 RepID=C6VUL9_DYAFD|nr:glycosyltransferase [Dyadobacter fermentans]ACT91328.1 glycosyl transferase group 1 [Dyadobacter fermentans DSM 18053]
MKIIQTIHALNPGGAERLVVELCNQFALRREDEVTVIILKSRSERNEDFYVSELDKPVKVVKMNFEDGFNFSYLIELYKKIKFLKPDVVHIHCVLDYLLLTILLYKRCKYVYTVHNIARVDLPGKLKYIVKFLSRLDLIKVATISVTNSKSYRAYTGLSNDTIVYNGRSRPEKTNLFHEAKSYTDAFRKEDNTLLLTIAKCSSQKNLGLLINSVKALRIQGFKLKLMIIGDGYDNSDLGKALKEMSDENIQFLGPKKNVADYFFLCDVYCISSLFEGMPITLIEALACGCTLVSTPVSGVVDIIENGKTGFVSSDFSEEQYIKTLKKFLLNKDGIDKSEINRLYTENFSIEVCGNNYYQLYES